MEIKKVGVLGCGLMGSGIAQVSATAGFDVTVLEVDEKYIEKGFTAIRRSLDKLSAKGALAEPVAAIFSRLNGTTRKQDLADCDFIVEAVIENLDEKRKMFASIDPIVKPAAIFASNTSSISITEIMTATGRPDRFVGLHFFNPVPLMKLVEVARTIATDAAVFEEVVAFAARLGKAPVRTTDRTGFIVNRLLVPYLLDAVRALEEGVATIVD